MSQIFSAGYRYPSNILGGVRVNQSIFGIPIPVVGGVNRISGNLLWYGDFIAKKFPTGKKGGSSGGTPKKGGGQYDFGAAVVIGLCQGPIERIGGIWSNTGYLPVNLTSEQFTVPGGGGSYTVTQVNTFLSDRGCQRADTYSVPSNDFASPYGSITLAGTQQTPMTVGAGTGQYTESGGTYHFHAGDAGKIITINYTYAPPITSGGTNQDPITTIGFSTFIGSQGQAVWSYLTSNHPSQAIGYSTVAYVATPLLDLGVSGTLPNFNFEIVGLDLANISGALLNPPGCDPSVWALDFLTNAIWGVGLVGGDVGSMTAYSNYCLANGLFISPVCDSSRTGGDYLKDWLDATNTELVESGGVLNFIPRGDTTVVGNGQTFTPSTAPIYTLSDDSLVRTGGDPPIVVERPSVQDAYNSIKIEFLDRTNNYNPSVVEAQDLGAIQKYKYRPEGTRSYHFFTQSAPAALAVQTLLSRAVYIRNKYQFKLSFRYFLLDPMDIVQIPANLIYGTADTTLINVRITSIKENNDRTLSVEAEDFPWGCSGPTLYPKQTPSPGGPNAYAAPGSVNTPIMFEALSRQNDQIGHTIWFGLSGTNPNWGGCSIWLSLDGTNYQRVGVAIGKTTMGVLTAMLASHADPDNTNTLSVDLTMSSGTLQTIPTADADSGANLCFVDGELIAFANAALVSANKYNLTYLRRGFFNSTIGSHASTSNFMLLDNTVEGYDYDVGLIGQTVHFKFTSFNQAGLVEESLANVTAYPFSITGACIGLLTPAHASYRPLTNPLTGHDAGASATINIASFTMRVPGQNDIAFGSGSITGLSYNTLYYVYFDDPGFIPITAPSYQATTTKETALNAAGRFFIGSITTPLAGAPDTIGNNDGGSGAQMGTFSIYDMSVAQTVVHSGTGTVTNLSNALDGNSTTFATMSLTATGGFNSAAIQLTGPPGASPQNYISATLKVLVECTVNSLAPAIASACVMEPGFLTTVFGNPQAATPLGSTSFSPTPTPSSPFLGCTVTNNANGTQTIAVPIAAGTNLSQVFAQLSIASGNTTPAGAVTLQVYKAWIEVIS